MNFIRNFFHKNIHLFILLFLLSVAILLRFYNFPFRYGLGDETVRDAVVGIEGARELQMPLTGAFSSAGAFTFGPWFYFQLIIFHLIVPTLYSSWIYLSLASLVCVYVLYKIGEFVEGKEFGLILAFFGVFSPALLIAGTHLTTQNMTNIFALLIVWLFLKLMLKKSSYWWYLLFGLCLGIGVNLHYQMAGLLVLPFIFMFSKLKKTSYFFISFMGGIITFLPLLFFDLNNHWFTLRNMLYYFQYGKNAIYVPNRWLFYLRDFWPAYWADVLGVPVVISWVIILAFICIIVWQVRKKILPHYMALLLLAFLFNFVLLRYYWGPRFFGYLNFLRPFVFIFSGYVIFQCYSLRFGRHIVFGLIAVLFYMIIPNSLEMLSKDAFSMHMYGVVESLEEKMPGKTLQVLTCTKSKQNMNAFAFSLIFLLDYNNKLTSKGIPIGINTEGCTDLSDEQKIPIVTGRQRAEDIILLDADIRTLSKAGWQLLSFEWLYDTTTRWWVREQH